MSEIATNILDHIVHLVPPGSLEQASEQFRALGFTVVTGGVHEGGHSMNDLVIFADAVYIEIILSLNQTIYHHGGPTKLQAG